jgi:hypothetical protein
MSQHRRVYRFAAETALAMAIAGVLHAPAIAQEPFTLHSDGAQLARQSFEHLLAGASPPVSWPSNSAPRRLGGVSFFTPAHATSYARICEFQEIGFQYDLTPNGQAQIAATPTDRQAFAEAEVAPTRMVMSNRYVVGPNSASGCRPSLTQAPIIAGSANDVWRGVTLLEALLANPDGMKIDCLSRTCPLAAVSAKGLNEVRGSSPGTLELVGDDVNAPQTSWILTFGSGGKTSLFVGPRSPR